MKTFLRSAFVGVLLSFLSVLAAAGAPENTPLREPDKETLRTINANRSLLAQYEADYERLQSELRNNPSDRLKRELENTGYKIKALNEDSAKLLDKLPEESKADELVKYVLARENAKKKAVMSSELDRLDTTARAFGSESQRYIQMHERALELVSQNRYEEAIRVYEDIILIKPDDDQAFMIMGHLYVMSGRFREAEKAFDQAVRIDPDDIREITPFYENQILKNPNDDTAHANLGYVYLMFKDYKNAEDAFQDALSINPDNPLALSGLELALNPNQPNP